jgi:hypothetical protein
MFVVPYNPGMQIANTGQLSVGTGAKYLEVMEPHEAGLPLVAIAWRRTKPKSLPKGRHLVEFAARRK